METEGDVLIKFKTAAAMGYINFFRRKVSHTMI